MDCDVPTQFQEAYETHLGSNCIKEDTGYNGDGLLDCDVCENRLLKLTVFWKYQLQHEGSDQFRCVAPCIYLSIALASPQRYSSVCIHISYHIHEILLNQSMTSKWMDNLFNIQWDQAPLMKITILIDEWLSSCNEIMGWKAKELF